MTKHMCIAVLICILAYVDSTPSIHFESPSYYSSPPYYPMAPSPCNPYPMMPPPCVRFPFSCPPQNGPSPCMTRNNNYRRLEMKPDFDMSINGRELLPQGNLNNMKRQIRRPYNPYKQNRKNMMKMRRRRRRRPRKFRGYPRKPNAGYPYRNGRCCGRRYGRRRLGTGLRVQSAVIHHDNPDTYYDSDLSRHDEPEDSNFDTADYDGDDDDADDSDYDNVDDYDDGEDDDNGMRRDEGENYDDDQNYEERKGFDESDNYDDADDDDDY